jgi:replicative superfamily II helicase
MDQNKKKDSPSDMEVDPFTAFMFGKPRIKDQTKQAEDLQNESSSKDDWLFGKRSFKQNKVEEENKTDHVLNDFLNKIDTDEIMKNVDLFIETAQEFKPLWKKIYPHIQKWVK